MNNEPSVTFTYRELLDLTNKLCHKSIQISKHIGPASLEYYIFQIIRETKGVDFFKYEAKLLKDKE